MTNLIIGFCLCLVLELMAIISVYITYVVRDLIEEMKEGKNE